MKMEIIIFVYAQFECVYSSLANGAKELIVVVAVDETLAVVSY